MAGSGNCSLAAHSVGNPVIRHSAVVRTTHWITAVALLALLVSGVEVTISHPRFYWGEDGNVLIPPLFSFPIPSSRATVPTGYGYVLPDQNGWSRSLHFEAAWTLVVTGLVYVAFGLASGHFNRNLVGSLRQKEDKNISSYNPLQRLAYLSVILVLSPLAIWTGLAMSPALAGAMPVLATVFGGRQSARTVHFVVAVLLVVFVVVHVVMVWRAGFTARVRAMIDGRAAGVEERV